MARTRDGERLTAHNKRSDNTYVKPDPLDRNFLTGATEFTLR